MLAPLRLVWQRDHRRASPTFAASLAHCSALFRRWQLAMVIKVHDAGSALLTSLPLNLFDIQSYLFNPSQVRPVCDGLDLC